MMIMIMMTRTIMKKTVNTSMAYMRWDNDDDDDDDDDDVYDKNNADDS